MVKRREGPNSSGARVVTLSVSRSSSTYVGFRIKIEMYDFFYMKQGIKGAFMVLVITRCLVVMTLTLTCAPDSDHSCALR
jgi:hypothetical protein